MSGGSGIPDDGEASDSLLVMGRIAAPFGVRGWLRVAPFTASMENLLEYGNWQIGRNGAWQTAQVLDGKLHGKGLVVQLEHCNDRDAAAALTGSDVAVYRSQLPATAAGEYYWNDLLGLQVVTETGQVLGVVDHLLETGANDVLVVKGERECLVPFLRDRVVKAIDLDAGVIRVDWDADF